MKEALKELRKIIQIPDQKHWNCMEMRERALEEWLDRWLIDLSVEQSALNFGKMPSEVQDILKEQLILGILDQVMTDVAIITTQPNKLMGQMSCIRRKPKV